jgi:mono/diheme cytochrome c family protein
MLKNPVFFFAGLMLFAAVVIISFQLLTQQNNPNRDFAWQQTANLYQKECASCHGSTGEGLDTYTILRGKHLPLTDIKEVLQKGRGDMPAFPAIKEPLLTALANYVHQF